MEAGLLHTDKHRGYTAEQIDGLANLSRWSLCRGAFLEEKAMENIFYHLPLSTHGSASHGEGFATPHGSKAGVLDLP